MNNKYSNYINETFVLQVLACPITKSWLCPDQCDLVMNDIPKENFMMINNKLETIFFCVWRLEGEVQ